MVVVPAQEPPPFEQVMPRTPAAKPEVERRHEVPLDGCYDLSSLAAGVLLH
ncbi:MAG: hypothetical protein HYX77_03415 [Acidobacteria bacterium]|nr:hypothetical protein [Acidobacteriota bacterium]